MRALLVLITLLSAASGCSKGPKPIDYGTQQCDHCRMTIADRRYGAEMVTETGKAYFFDAIECMAAFSQLHTEPPIRSRWVTDFESPGELIPAETAAYLRSEKLKSPMGLNLSAFKTPAQADKARELHGGERLSWDGVQELVRSSGFIRSTTSSATR